MKKILFFLFLCSFSIQGQSYSIAKISSNTNGNLGPMKGVPGDLFASTITFSNSSASVIHVVVDRYKNDKPTYWAICYCYIQCHNPSEDSIYVEIQPLSTTDVTLQFKTDSVNPGIAKEGFSIYEIGFSGNVQDLQMTATTMNDVGITKVNAANSLLHIFPNPSVNNLNVILPEIIKSINVTDALGQNVVSIDNIESNKYLLNTSAYPNGIYFIEVNSEKKQYIKRFIRN